MESSLYPKINNVSAAIYEYESSHIHTSKDGFSTISFGYILRGTVCIETDDAEFSLACGDLFAISPRCRYRSVWIGGPDVKFYSLHLLPDPDAEIFTFPPQKIGELSVPETGERMLAIIRCMESEEYSERMRALSLFCGFYADAVPYLRNISTQRFHPALVTAMQYIDRNYRMECGIEELCDETYVSPAHLYYLFRRELNTTPVHYRNCIRIAKAAEQLRVTERDELDIAESCGFHTLTESYTAIGKLLNCYLVSTCGIVVNNLPVENNGICNISACNSVENSVSLLNSLVCICCL